MVIRTLMMQLMLFHPNLQPIIPAFLLLVNHLLLPVHIRQSDNYEKLGIVCFCLTILWIQYWWEDAGCSLFFLQLQYV